MKDTNYCHPNQQLTPIQACYVKDLSLSLDVSVYLRLLPLAFISHTTNTRLTFTQNVPPPHLPSHDCRQSNHSRSKDTTRDMGILCQTMCFSYFGLDEIARIVSYWGPVWLRWGGCQGKLEKDTKGGSATACREVEAIRLQEAPKLIC